MAADISAPYTIKHIGRILKRMTKIREDTI